MPLGDEAEADHCGSPEDGDCWEESPRSNLSQDDRSRGLQQNVRNKKYKNDDRVAFSDELEVDPHAGCSHR
jgi:hypothetical protein